MAKQLDLEEQEQLDQLKEFWNRYGNLITGVLVLALAAYAGWNGWQWWQRDQAMKAASLYDELDRAATQGDVDKVGRVFSDMRDRYASTTYAEQAALLAAKVQNDKGKVDDARATLAWLGDHGKQPEYQAIARLRLAGLLMDRKQYDEAMKMLDNLPASFKGLAADRRGDILQQMGKREQAIAAYQEAWKAMDAKLEYRALVRMKLEALGRAPDQTPAAPAREGASS